MALSLSQMSFQMYFTMLEEHDWPSRGSASSRVSQILLDVRYAHASVVSLRAVCPFGHL